MNLYERYQKEIIPHLQKQLGIANVLAVPRVLKVVVSVGLNRSKEEQMKETVMETLTRITGQKPVVTKAKKSVSSFKIRQGQDVGALVTLRGKRMYDFIEKLIGYAFPRGRDFRGIPPSVVDVCGNASFGFREHLGFPEIRTDEVERVHGLEVSVATNAKTREKGLALLKALGFPFQEQ